MDGLSAATAAPYSGVAPDSRIRTFPQRLPLLRRACRTAGEHLLHRRHDHSRGAVAPLRRGELPANSLQYVDFFRTEIHA
jgi:hypothetical protein